MDWIATAAVMEAVGTIGAVVVGIGFGVPALRQGRREAAERNRPMVVAELQPPTSSARVVWFALRNYGPVIARDVRVVFDPPLSSLTRSEMDSADMIMSFVERRYVAADGSPRVIPTLSPGQELRQVFATELHVNKVPDVVRVTVTSCGPDGQACPPDVFVLDATVMLGTTMVASDASLEGRLKQIVRLMQAADRRARAAEARHPAEDAAIDLPTTDAVRAALGGLADVAEIRRDPSDDEPAP